MSRHGPRARARRAPPLTAARARHAPRLEDRPVVGRLRRRHEGHRLRHRLRRAGGSAANCAASRSPPQSRWRRTRWSVCAAVANAARRPIGARRHVARSSSSERSVPLELSMMSTDVLRRSPLPPVLRDGRGTTSPPTAATLSSTSRRSFAGHSCGRVAGSTAGGLARRRARRRLPLRRRRPRPRPRRAAAACSAASAGRACRRRCSNFAAALVLRAARPRQRPRAARGELQRPGVHGWPRRRRWLHLHHPEQQLGRRGGGGGGGGRRGGETSLGICAQRVDVESLRARGLNCDAYHSEPDALRGRVHDGLARLAHALARRRPPSSTATSATCRAVCTTRAARGTAAATPRSAASAAPCRPPM